MAAVAWNFSLTLSLLAVLIPLISFRYAYGIHKFRGPFLASFTDLWRFIHAYHGTLFPLRDLHDTYGDVMRIGPRALSFRDPRAIRDIFGAGKNWDKVCITRRLTVCRMDLTMIADTLTVFIVGTICYQCSCFKGTVGPYLILKSRPRLAQERPKSNATLFHPDRSIRL